ncbi:MAG: HigA family addiction module antidote protein [Chlorobium sp.]|jgi:addiction module HigA family antidote|uniref:HigA family addiction module antitoxin n=1 Tax=Chlorobium sp. TaxID=1095 RepID=UPI001DF10127|nr:HigA family addiction module antitoxin [Chlorobium sp.]MBN1278779.1 HigA family addiction module antidote protein [Chlorobiaceae bacterium]MCF8216657.1 HigA family addiction module antidote protein [Chlorobium sp.]MCF8271527.1 HigA family addiction module antidote protein [Chlorobium sp.]MCF8287899.1 HigA family addiction module antidote protein [Chlorobium sp.]MCF8291473.1 HigA family addiction module antidote protein [Chlorobium sp.]
MAIKNKPLHPGTVLLEDFLCPLQLTEKRLARDIRIPVWKINDIITGKRCMTADTALRLARYFSTPAQFWFGLQMDYDLKVAMNDAWASIEKEINVFDSEGR